MASKRPMKVVAGLLFLCLPSSVTPTIWRVTPDGGGDAPTIQAAMDSASAGDTVLVAAGNYTWTSQNATGESMVQLRNGVRLRGELGATQTILDAENNGRVMRSRDPGEVSISGLTITRGYSDGLGGGILSDFSDLIVSDCIIRDNLAGIGGGLACYEGTGLIVRCQFLRNTSDAGSAGGGGAASCENTVFSHCTFYDNRCFGQGAGGGAVILATRTGYPVSSLKDCWFEGNSGTAPFGAWGGAVSANGDSVLRCMFVANVATNGSALSGGGYVEDCIFIANESFTGPTISISPHGKLVGCTVVGNSSPSPSFASAVFLQPGMVENSIIAFNEGSACSGSGTFICSNLFGNTQSDLLCGVDGGGNISVDPLFCTPDPIASLDASLRSSSPCLPENNSCEVLIGATGEGCTTSSVQESLNSATAELRLGTWPNPFKSGTWITYSAARIGRVRLSIYDSRGKLIKTLVEKTHGPGDYVLSWSGVDEAGRSVPSGMYIARIVSNGQMATQKLILTK